jgi:hypothetical protein
MEEELGFFFFFLVTLMETEELGLDERETGITIQKWRGVIYLSSKVFI